MISKVNSPILYHEIKFLFLIDQTLSSANLNNNSSATLTSTHTSNTSANKTTEVLLDLVLNDNNQATTPKTNPQTTQTSAKSKTFIGSDSSTSSTSSNSSTSSACSSRTGSNETPKLTSATNKLNFNHSECSINSDDHTFSRQLHLSSNNKPNEKHSPNKKISSSSSTSSTSSTSANSNKTPTTFNIENELIKYTKNLKLNNRNYTDYYNLGAHIRNGGFSEIYEGTKKSNPNLQVIIKLIPKRKTKNWLMVHNKKYPAEILLHRMCNSIDGVVEMLEFFEQENEWIIIMPKVDNCMDLFDYLESKQRGRLNESEACFFFTQLVKINSDLLAHGVVHRDIKSENILVDMNSMKLILIDFGASAICRNKSSASSQIHQYTDFHGTRQYKPPEYILYKKYTALASTTWTLGILLVSKQSVKCAKFLNKTNLLVSNK